eukprot:194110-Chlamydomonas_euryale.AAC.6
MAGGADVDALTGCGIRFGASAGMPMSATPRSSTPAGRPRRLRAFPTSVATGRSDTDQARLMRRRGSVGKGLHRPGWCVPMCPTWPAGCGHCGPAGCGRGGPAACGHGAPAGCGPAGCGPAGCGPARCGPAASRPSGPAGVSTATTRTTRRRLVSGTGLDDACTRTRAVRPKPRLRCATLRRLNCRSRRAVRRRPGCDVQPCAASIAAPVAPCAQSHALSRPEPKTLVVTLPPNPAQVAMGTLLQMDAMGMQTDDQDELGMGGNLRRMLRLTEPRPARAA